MKKPTQKTKQVKKDLTLSMYDGGMHSFTPSKNGTVSVKESMVPFSSMLEELYRGGVSLGSVIEVTMKVKKPAKRVK